MSADNDKGQCLCVANPEEWKTNLATVRPTFASPHNKRQRKKLAVFKGKETSHEPFLNGQTNALHLHIMNGPYYSKSKCRLWDTAQRPVAECLSETRKLLTRESARFTHKATDTGPQTVQKRWLFASPGTRPKLQSDFILLQATKMMHRSVCWGSWGRDVEQTPAKSTIRYRWDAVLCNIAELVEPLSCWWRKVAPE